MTKLIFQETISLIKWVLFFLCIMFIFRLLIGYVCEVNGASMNPTLADEDRLIVSRVPYYLHDPERFDVIVFKSQDGRDFVKRVIGLPGDTIRYENDQLYINEQEVDEPFLEKIKSQFREPFTSDFVFGDKGNESIIPEGYIFVLGDNRQNSMDSREFGLVPLDSIQGKALTRMAPFDKLVWNVSEVTYAETE